LNATKEKKINKTRKRERELTLMKGEWI